MLTLNFNCKTKKKEKEKGHNPEKAAMIQRKFVNSKPHSGKENRYIRLYTHPSYGNHETFHPLLCNHLFIK